MAPGTPHNQDVSEGYLSSYRELLTYEDEPFDFFQTVAFHRSTTRVLAAQLVPSLNGVETRLGFGGADLLLFGRSMPGELRDELSTVRERRLLTAAYGHLIPSAYERKVVGGKPGAWLGRSIMFAGVRLLKETGLFTPEKLESLLRKFEARSGRERQSLYMKIWRLFGLQVWLDTYVNRVDARERIMRAASEETRD